MKSVDLLAMAFGKGGCTNRSVNSGIAKKGGIWAYQEFFGYDRFLSKSRRTSKVPYSGLGLKWDQSLNLVPKSPEFAYKAQISQLSSVFFSDFLIF